MNLLPYGIIGIIGKIGATIIGIGVGIDVIVAIGVRVVGIVGKVDAIGVGAVGKIGKGVVEVLLISDSV